MSDLFENAAPLARGQTLSDQATEALRRYVVNGDWPVGSMLPSEAALSQKLDVSRSVIREAVSRLKAEGLLASHQGRGAFVSSNRSRMGFSIDEQDVDNRRKLAQILELRLGVEIEAAAIAAIRRDNADLEQIHAAVSAFAAVQKFGPEQVRAGVDADLQFHRAICVATQNDYYLGLFNYLSASLRETIEAGRNRSVERGGDSREAAEEHRAVAEAIEAQDSLAARKLMRKHLELSSARLLGHLWNSEDRE
ncbi:FadR/GntR family transcriptional regulator [Paracoccus saliphilus]|uniref:FadR family transcriptional regulator n=1 Tax=Paracoccus saliphilus TaxID=405559 RepID=A0AA45W0T8_9RHOB|nr:FadR/GntR family transcriptional regulator [Paracoccus saliphilus]WCR03333.1 FadR family transcriptional regulator [Paracoccus saliphilus]SIS51641.1 transcriptional regulator, GntR family [Paracoccus saliphilus]